MITDKENEFVLIDNYNSKFRIELKDDYWHFVIDEEEYDEFSCGICRFSFKANNNQVIADLIANLFDEINRSSNEKDLKVLAEDIGKAVNDIAISNG